MALPASWLDRIIGRLAVRYGSSWFALYDGVDTSAWRADWADVLDGLERRPDALRYAMEHLPPDRPPNAAQFKALCDRAPIGTPQSMRLPAPAFTPNHAAVERIRAQVGLAAKPIERHDGMTAAQLDVRKALARRQTAALAAPERPRECQGPLPWPAGVERPPSAEPPAVQTQPEPEDAPWD